MKSFRDEVVEAARYVRARIPLEPQVGLLVGTGLGGSADRLADMISLDYADIPNCPAPTAPSHRGKLLSGTMSGKGVMVMQGRFHYYEGYRMEETTFSVRLLQVLGVKHLIITNAAGGINPLFSNGDIMVIVDHINLTGANPLIGPNVDEWGPRFPDMTRVYDPDCISLAERAALDEGIRIQKGVYVGLAGPSLETRAEIRMLKLLGADAVGLSTIAEVIAAVHAGMAVLAFSVITNMNLPDNPVACSVEEIVARAERAAPRLQGIIERVVANLPL